MVKREQLNALIKEKILLMGDSGTGKTYTVVKVVEHVVAAGKTVVLVDPEYGAERELELLSDEILEGIELRISPEWEDFRRDVFKEDNCFLKVVDGLSETFIASRLFLEDRYVKVGKYQVGESQVDITDREIFTLPWQGYPKVYDALRRTCFELVKQKPHMIVTMHSLGETATKQKVQEDIYRKFDTIMEMRRRVEPTKVLAEGKQIDSEKIVYDALLMKHRGRPISSRALLENPVEALKKLFDKRMGGGEKVEG